MSTRTLVLVLSILLTSGCAKTPGKRMQASPPQTMWYPEYGIIAPGDLIRVEVGDYAGGVPYSQYCRVSTDGRAELFKFGSFKVSGLSADEACKAISKAFNDAKWTVRAQVFVEIVPDQTRN